MAVHGGPAPHLAPQAGLLQVPQSPSSMASATHRGMMSGSWCWLEVSFELLVQKELHCERC